MDIITTEQRILKAAQSTFLRFGFHGTKLQQIAEIAKVNKSVIHYYFRTKEKLYKEILRKIILYIESADLMDENLREENLKVKWFLYTEIYNNQTLFEKILNELYPADWSTKQNRIIELLKIEKVF